MASGLLAGRLAVITGAGSGIGRSICEVFAREGARVAAVDINPHGLQETLQNCAVSDGPHQAFTCDVSKSSDVSSFMEALGKTYTDIPTIAVNCAGINRPNFLLKMTEEQFDKVIAVNLKSSFLMTKAVGKLMKEHKPSEAAIINIASITAKNAPPMLGNYSSAKAGMVALTKTAAKELGRYGVRCNAVLPGFIDTPLTSEEEVTEGIRDLMIRFIPAGRPGQPKEVAEACLFLASKRSSYITGACIEVTGGLDM